MIQVELSSDSTLDLLCSEGWGDYRMLCFRFQGSFRLAICGLAALGWIALGSSARANDDTGTLIVTLNDPTLDGAPTDLYRTYFIEVKTLDGKHGARIRYEDKLLVKSPNDLAAVGKKGAVITKELQAGDWAVYMYEVEAIPSLRLRPTKEFSIPFKISPGRATYIGSFQPVGHMTKGIFGASTVGGARLVITDQSARDVPIAQAKTPNLGPVDVSVYDVGALNNPILSNHEDAVPAPSDDQFCRWMNLLGCLAYP